MAFVHLHSRTHYSFLDGAMSPSELVSAAVANGQTAVAMTDSANLCGLVEFYNACMNSKIKPIFGAEIWVGHEVKIPADGKQEASVDLVPHHLMLLLVRNEAGYRNLCALLTLAHRQRHYAPLLSLEQLIHRCNGLVGVCVAEHGPVAMLGPKELSDRLQVLQKGFGEDSLYLELVDWGLPEQEGLNAKIKASSSSTGIPLLATNNCRYSKPEDTALYNVMRQISDGEDEGHCTDQATVKTEAEMLELFDAEHVNLSGDLAEQLCFVPEMGRTFLPDSHPPEGSRVSQWQWLLKRFPLPKAFGEQDCSAPMEDVDGWDLVDTYFAWYARVGLDVRLKEDNASDLFGSREDYFSALEMELSVIQRMKFPTYHLIVAEFTNWAKDNDIAVGPGRGSAAGSVVVWALQITDLNPLQWGLMFERYLNPKRISMPDIDMDFEQERREDVISHVREKYGDECVAQILTIGTMKSKGALKDCARACSIHFMDADKWSKQIPDGPKVYLKPSIDENPYLKAMYDGDPKFRNVADLALAIEGRPRQTGVHAAGVIITSRPVSDFVPMHFEHGSAMTGMEMNASEKMGLVKFDFLGLKTLDIIEEACRSIQKRTGVRPQITQPLFDDPGVYELMSEGDTLGLFQVESHGMQNLVRRMKPDCMEDLIAILALYRPGPLGSGMVDQYIECKHGRMKVVYPHALLEETLKPTHGVIVYQEQVMKSAQALAGYDLAAADLLRRAMGKKKQEEMDLQRSLFVDGCARNDISEDDATRIFNLIDHFAGYGFNKTISQETWVLRAGSNAHTSTPWIQIKTLVELWDARVDGRLTPMAKKLRSGRLNLIQMDADGKCRPGRLLAIHDHGVKPVYRLVTANGHISPSMSLDHRVLTADGYKSVSMGLKVGDDLVFMGEHEDRAYSAWWLSDDSRFSQKYRCNNSYRDICDEVWERDNSRCQQCGVEGEKRRGGHEVAHIQTPEECSYLHSIYHSVSNLRLLCNCCHKSLDYEKGERTKRWQKGRPTFMDKIVSIEFAGEEQCYDLEMESVGHNYVAAKSPESSGIISHNSHSASYAVITYMTAYLKAHHRADLMAAAMSLEQKDREKLVSYVYDSTYSGMDVLGPDINESMTRFSAHVGPERSFIRFGLEAVKGVGGAALQSILAARLDGPFTSLSDIQERTTANKAVLQALVYAGALDSIEPSRFEAWWLLNCPAIKSSIKRRDSPNQMTLFGGGKTAGQIDEEDRAEKEAELKPKAWTYAERLDFEFSVLGCWLSGHPLDRYVDVEQRIKTVKVNELELLKKSNSVTLIGVITKIHKIKTRQGSSMVFFTLADRSGMTEVVLRPQAWERFKTSVVKGDCVQVKGRMDRDGAEGKVIVDDVQDLSVTRINAKTLELTLAAEELCEEQARDLKILLDQYIIGKQRQGCKLRVLLDLGEDTFLKITLPQDPVIDPDKELFDAIEVITGRPNALRIPGSATELPIEEYIDTDGVIEYEESKLESYHG